MRVPKPALREYATFTVVVLATAAALQYAGIFAETAGTIDWRYLVILGIVLPMCTYLWTVLVENVGWLPDWERMKRSDRQ